MNVSPLVTLSVRRPPTAAVSRDVFGQIAYILNMKVKKSEASSN